MSDRATDIHFEPLRDSLQIRYRIDGELISIRVPDNLIRFQDAIISRLKIMAKLNISEKKILPTFLLFIVLSWPLAAHRFFLRRYASAILFILTIGGVGIWWIIDFILIVTGSMKDDEGKLVKLWVD